MLVWKSYKNNWKNSSAKVTRYIIPQAFMYDRIEYLTNIIMMTKDAFSWSIYEKK